MNSSASLKHMEKSSSSTSLHNLASNLSKKRLLLEPINDEHQRRKLTHILGNREQRTVKAKYSIVIKLNLEDVTAESSINLSNLPIPRNFKLARKSAAPSSQTPTAQLGMKKGVSLVSDNPIMDKLKLRLKQKKSSIVLDSPANGGLSTKNISPWKFASARFDPTIPKWKRLFINIPGYKTKENLSILRIIKVQKKRAVRVIETRYRDYCLKKVSAVIIQSYTRKMLACRNLVKKVKAIIKIQSLVRQKKERKQFITIRKTVIKIQSVMRSFKQKKTYHRKLKSIKEIQKFLKKKHIEFQQRRHKASIKIQSLFQMIRPIKQLKTHIQQRKQKEAMIKRVKTQKEQQLLVKARKEAVRRIETWWALILLRRELRVKRKEWALLPKDCRMLWIRFALLKEQAFDLRDDIQKMKCSDL